MKKFKSFILGLVVLFCIAGCKSKEIGFYANFNIIHTNDIHGYVEGQNVSLSQIATLKDFLANSILVDAGDATQGAPFATLSHGEDVIRMMNETGYDMMTLGNHEFDSGIEQLKKNQSIANFPMLSCNTYQGDDSLMKNEKSNGAYIIKTIDNAKVGIIGVTTRETKTSSNPNILDTVKFTSETAEVIKIISTIKEETDTIVIVSHMGDLGLQSSSYYLREEIIAAGFKDEVSCIIDGHSHAVINHDNGILIAQTGSGLENVGVVNIKLTSDSKIVKETLVDTSYYKKKESVTALYSAISSTQNEFLNTEFSDIPHTLVGGFKEGYAFCRFSETNLGNLISDAILKKMKETFSTNYVYKDIPMVAVENGGGIRGELKKGKITYGDLLTVFPYGNTIQFKCITAKTLYEVMEQSVSLNEAYDPETGILSCKDNNPNGGFLQVAGFKFYYNPNNPVNQKVERIILDDDTVLAKDDSKIIIGANNYLLSGGNSYSMLTDEPVIGETLGELELLQDYLEYLNNNPSLFENYISGQNRINIINGNQNLKAMITIIGTYTKATLDGVEVTLTQEDGIYILDVTDGLHIVTIDNIEFIVCNYSGHGFTNTVSVDVSAGTYKYSK